MDRFDDVPKQRDQRSFEQTPPSSNSKERTHRGHFSDHRAIRTRLLEENIRDGDDEESPTFILKHT